MPEMLSVLSVVSARKIGKAVYGVFSDSRLTAYLSALTALPFLEKGYTRPSLTALTALTTDFLFLTLGPIGSRGVFVVPMQLGLGWV